ncbi:transcriptional regulator BetI [Parashewanella spongiae]|uniref:HTH-type transcriptional regulator BetI n=1 Tax=Parashewanella spongiae TaxID=342950 RepID=A0A3A6TVD8_9GAMM|nr:transcriptional regulator BetI [Parashewanella spongiae]MCL1078053.1 transcriptional regulator BetI [Parashewanella spongiae]RJY16927.1 transcriptional regulator BetI [Parashewanella spongiae]
MSRNEIKYQRKKELINATLKSVECFGLHNTTINTISANAGLSSGIISHYFGGKQGLIEATLRYLIDGLKQALLSQTRDRNLSPEQRLLLIVEANFTDLQQSNAATKTWLSFWAQAMHDDALARLQRVNNQRLYSNLLFSFSQVLERTSAIQAAKQTAAMIDGFWLRSALDSDPKQAFEQAKKLCKSFISVQLQGTDKALQRAS